MNEIETRRCGQNRREEVNIHMNTFMNTRWVVGMMGTALLACAVVFCGCESEDTDSDITPTRFSLDQDLVSYSAVDNFIWDTTLNQATATIRIKDFTRGDVTFRVFDANGKVLLTRALFTPNNTIYTGGNDFVVTDQTAIGVAGAWRVELGYDDFTGEISITME